MKKLKYWNGRGHGEYHQKHLMVAAYSQKQASDLLSKVCNTPVPISEIRTYYSKCWGSSMEGITENEPCVYWEEKWTKSSPKKIKI